MSVHAVVHAAGARVLPEHMTGRYHAKPLMLNDKILLSHSWEQNNILLECDGVKASNLRCIRNFDSVSKDHILGMYVGGVGINQVWKCHSDIWLKCAQ